MSSFMDDIAEDLEDTFFDTDTWGTLHEVNGKSIPIIFNEEKLNKIKKIKQSASKFQDDVYKAECFFYAKEADLGSSIGINELMNLDGKERFICYAELIDGLWNIMLGRKRV